MRKQITFIVGTLITIATITLLAQPANAQPTYQEELISHGSYIANIAGCTFCHTPNKVEFQDLKNLTLEQNQIIAFRENEAIDTEKFMAGGRFFDLTPAGAVFSRNLTPDEETGIGTWTNEQIRLAVKTGINANGEILFPVMPYHVYNGMADSDLEAVITFLRSINAIKNTPPEDTVSKDGLTVLPYPGEIIAPNPSDRAARGKYLVENITGCTDCHTPVNPSTGEPIMEQYLAGRQPYEGPWGIVYGGNITPDTETGIGDWTEEEIKRALLTGVNKDGRRLILMPWYAYANLTTEDADAIAYYLKHELPAVYNEIPSPSLNEGFEITDPVVSATQTNTSPASIPPYLFGVIGLLLVMGSYIFSRKSTQNTKN